MNNFFTIIFFLLLVGCSNKKVKEKENIYTGVDVNLAKNNSTDVKLDLKSNIGTYGPDFESESNYKSNDNQKKSIGILITPSHYKSVLALDLLKCFQINDIKINLISGAGFGSLLAALYAQNDSSEEIRWKIINKTTELLKINNFSKDWVKEWERFIDKNINEEAIINSSVSLWIPDIIKGKVVYRASKNIKEQLKNNLNPQSKKYTLNYNLFNEDKLSKLPVDRVLVVNTLGEKITFLKPNEMMIGIYGKVHSFSEQSERIGSKIRVINIEEIGALDDASLRIHMNHLKPICNQVLDALK